MNSHDVAKWLSSKLFPSMAQSAHLVRSTPFERIGGVASYAADELQSVHRKRLSPATAEKRKDSTDQTTTERFETHLFAAFENCELGDLTRDRLQDFLAAKARSGLSRSVVSHLRWDLNAVFKMAAEDTLVQGNPAGSLVTPKCAQDLPKRTMSKEQVQQALSPLDLRERIVFLLAVLVGMRPGTCLPRSSGRTEDRARQKASGPTSRSCIGYRSMA
jgi:hypothetical protein